MRTCLSRRNCLTLRCQRSEFDTGKMTCRPNRQIVKQTIPHITPWAVAGPGRGGGNFKLVYSLRRIGDFLPNVPPINWHPNGLSIIRHLYPKCWRFFPLNILAIFFPIYWRFQYPSCNRGLAIFLQNIGDLLPKNELFCFEYIGNFMPNKK